MIPSRVFFLLFFFKEQFSNLKNQSAAEDVAESYLSQVTGWLDETGEEL